MKRIFTLIIILLLIIFPLSYQSFLINRNVSKIPFTPNIFVSPSNVKETLKLEDVHSGGYAGKLNDSINNVRFISKTQSYNYRVNYAVWIIKYENMNSINLLNYLNTYGIFLFDLSDKEKHILNKKNILFRNHNINQYLNGRYNEKDSSYSISYEYPKTYIPFKERNTFKKSLKDFLIGAPH